MSIHSVAGDGFEIHFSWDGDVLIARVEGKHDNFDISLAYWRMIAEERLRRGAMRILVLEHLQQSGSAEMLMALSEHLLEMASDFNGAKLAFVDLSDSHRAMQEHLAIEARERGTQAAVFASERQALTWLKYGVD